jgi:hypothetical protein
VKSVSKRFPKSFFGQDLQDYRDTPPGFFVSIGVNSWLSYGQASWLSVFFVVNPNPRGPRARQLQRVLAGAILLTIGNIE